MSSSAPVDAGYYETKKDFVEKNHSRLVEVLVHDRPVKGGEEILYLKTEVQGIWQDNTRYGKSPCTLWAYPAIPLGIDDVLDVYGLWGYRPGIEPPDDLTKLNPEDIWFFGPKSRPSPIVTACGIWFLPMVQRDLSFLSKHESGFLDVSVERPKAGKLDVDGPWKMLYTKGGDDDDDVKGPGLSPRKGKGPGMSPRKGLKTKRRKSSKKSTPTTLNLTIETPDGKAFSLQVDGDTSIDELKSSIENKTEVLKEDQELNFRNLELKANNTLNDYFIKDGDTIVLEPMKLHIHHWNGDQFIVMVDPLDTIDELKDKIESAGGIPKENQRLSFREKPLSRPSNTLERYNIHNRSIIKLDQMQIRIERMQEKPMAMKVDPKDTIMHIEKRIEKKLKIPVLQQILTLDGTQLQDERDLRTYSIAHGTKLQLDEDVEDKHATQSVSNNGQQQFQVEVPRRSRKPHPRQASETSTKTFRRSNLSKIRIHVKDWEEKKTTYEVEPTYTIDEIKNRIQDRLEIPKDMLRLAFGERMLKDKKKTLQYYNVEHDDLLVLEPIEIMFKMPDGQTVPVLVKPNETLSHLKDRISREADVPMKDKILRYKGRTLDDDDDTVIGCGLVHGAEVVVDSSLIELKGSAGRMDDSSEIMQSDGYRSMSIFVELPDGRTLPLDIDSDTDVSSAKKVIEDIGGVPSSKQRIIFGGRTLREGETLAEAGVKSGDTIEIPAAISVTHKPLMKLTVDPKPKKSYLPPKTAKADNFGKIITKTYTVDHNVDSSDTFVLKATGETVEKVKMSGNR